MLKKLIPGCLCTLLALSASLGSYSHAASAEAEDSATSAEPAAKLAEVIVQAQKRSEDLQSVPISVQVLTGADLTQRNSTALEDVAETVPGVNITSRSASNLITIRGIGSGENADFDQSVAIFSDDIYHGRSRMSLGTFLDLDHLEVLKGPQSTFFGNNAVAGALNIVTRRPGNTFEGDGRLMYGQFGQYAAEGAVGGPITDVFGARLAVTRNGVSRGWLFNEATGEHLPRINNLAGRLSLDFHPDSLEAVLKIESSRHTTSGSGNELPEQMTNCPPPAPLPPIYNWIYGTGVCTTALAKGYPVGIEQNKIAQLPGQGNSLSTFESTLTVNYTQWGHTFTSVTGFYNYHFDNPEDGTQLPLPSQTLAAFDHPEKYHQFSQELRVASPTGQPIEYLAGAYFQTDHLETPLEIHGAVFNGLGAILGIPSQYLPLAEYLPLAQTSHTYSVFGSVKWNVTDTLRLNAGLRASRVTKDASTSRQYAVATSTFRGFAPVPADVEATWASVLGPTYTYDFSRTDDALMPSAGLEYQILPDAMLYFSYSRGFKAGGFTNNFGTAGSFSFNPEHVNSYELGLKSKWLQDTVLFNLDIFRMNYKDLQLQSNVTVNGLPESYVANAAEAVSQGVEMETQWAVNEAFRLGANVTYLHSYFSNYADAAIDSDLQKYCAISPSTYASIPECAAHYPFPVPASQDLTGQPTPYAPRWTGTLSASYSIALPRDLLLTLQTTPYFTTSFNHQNPDLRGLNNNGYVRLDARISLETADGHWGLDVIGKNLTDRTIIVFPVLGFQSKEQPRNVAGQIRFRW